jgi:ABC-2 type transport system permease protein
VQFSNKIELYDYFFLGVMHMACSLRVYVACLRLGVQRELAYPLNFVVDSVVNPFIVCGVEMSMWYAIVASQQGQSLNGYSVGSYLIYFLWGSFFSRQLNTWSQEYAMGQEIYSGQVNASLTRPVSYIMLHFFQFLGQRFIRLFIALGIPIVLSMVITDHAFLMRLPMALIVGFLYLFFNFKLAQLFLCLAFYLHRVNSVVFSKNVTLWVLTGELFPLDLLPDAAYRIARILPFASGVFIPVGYLSGRIGDTELMEGMIGLVAGIVGVTCAAEFAWARAVRHYSGLGA